MGFAIADMVMGSPDYAGMAKGQEAQRQQNITQGTQNINKAFQGFTPSFYQQRAQDYQNFAMPQLAQQYQSNRNDIGFGLANRNLLASSAARNQWTNLDKQMGQAKQQIVDTGISQSQQLQQQVENQRNSLLGQLYQSADPANAKGQATQVAASFAQPSVYPAMGNMFGNLANQYYMSQLINSYRQPQGGSNLPTYSAAPGALPNQASY